jgi:hypothetical protein
MINPSFGASCVRLLLMTIDGLPLYQAL